MLYLELFTQRYIRFLRSSVLLILLSFVISGCGGHSGQSTDYTKLRPSKKLAALSFQQDLMLVEYETLPLHTYSKTYDLTPGEHVFELIFYDTGTTNPDVRITTGKVTKLTVNAVAGKLYYIYPSFPDSDQWQPEMHEFVRPDKLSSYSKDFWRDLEKGLSIEQITAKYF